MDAGSPEEALAQIVRFVAFNYDRSLEYLFLAHAWHAKHNPDQLVDPSALSRMFIHLHGQLGSLPEIRGDGRVVQKNRRRRGASPDGIGHSASRMLGPNLRPKAILYLSFKLALS